MRTAASGSPAAAAPAAARLERYGNKSLRTTIYLCPKRCKSRFCPDCAKALAWQTREKMLRAARAFRAPRMLTLTVDPERHASEQAALDHVRKGQYIRKLMDSLGITTWAWVLEFQANGWPHWHVLIDVGDLRGRRVDYRLAHALWRKWGIGEQIHFSKRHYKDALHAVMYITKYLTKPPRYGWPAFIIEMRRAPRVFAMSRSASAASKVGEPDSSPSVEDRPVQARRSASTRTVGERVAECRESVTLVAETITPQGELRRKFLGDVPLSVAMLYEHHEELGLRFGADVVHFEHQAVARFKIECPGVRSRLLPIELQRRSYRSGLLARRQDRINRRRCMLQWNGDTAPFEAAA